jgi:PAS domain S-box-containing protein
MSTPDSNRWLKSSAFLNYGAAVLSVIVALFIARWMQIEYEFQPLTPFLCAIMFSAWLGGLKPGLFAVALSLLAFHHYFLSPILPSGVEKEIPRLLLAAATALFIMSLAAAQRSVAEALRESELRLRQIAENIREVFWMAYRALDEPLYVSPAYEKIWGRSLEGLRQQPRSFFEAIHAEDREHAAGIIIGQGEQEIDIEYRIVKPDGSLRWIRDRRFPVKDASGTVCRIAGVAEDITERKLAEMALKQADDRLRLVLDTTPALIHTGRPDGYLDYINQRWLKYAGLSLEDLQGWAWTATIHPEDVEGILNKWRECLASGEPLQHEARLRRADGEYRWMLHRKVPLRDEHGNVVKWYGSSIDIEDRKRVEEALWNSEQKLREQEGLYRMLTENANDFIRVHELDGRSIYASPSVMRLYGQEPARIFQFAHPDDLAICRQWWEQVLAKGREPLLWRVRDRDGGWRWMETQGSLVRYHGQPHVMTVCRDVTEWKKAEEEALENARTIQAMSVQREEHLRLVIDTIPTMAWSLRPDGVVDFLNQRWLDYSGLSLEQYVEEPTGMIHPEDIPRVLEKWLANMAVGEPFEDEMRLRRADGEFRWFLVRDVPLRDERGNIVKWYGTSTDIEDRKRAEYALRDAAAQLEALSQRLVALQEFERKELARELHDRIGQSLTALNINLKILATALPSQASDQLRARLADSEELVESTAAAIRNVMSELRPPMLDDQGLVPALDWYARQFSARTGISVAVRAQESAERPAPEMEIALFRVVQEALNNVVKHAQASRVEIILGRSGSEYVMTVEDDGVGFDAAEVAVAPQLGLGMVTMRERTQALGGRLEVRAGRGDGTRLTVRVPA